MAKASTTITALDYTDLLDKISTSGMFEMTDCNVEIWCPEKSNTEEIKKMVHLIESMVHVLDVKIGSSIEDLVSDSYRVILKEPPAKNRFTK
jgi:hypothetical protein